MAVRSQGLTVRVRPNSRLQLGAFVWIRIDPIAPSVMGKALVHWLRLLSCLAQTLCIVTPGHTFHSHTLWNSVEYSSSPVIMANCTDAPPPPSQGDTIKTFIHKERLVFSTSQATQILYSCNRPSPTRRLIPLFHFQGS